MIGTVVGRRGQITIPRAVRRLLRIAEGDRIAFVSKGEDVVIQPIRTTLRDHRGSVPVAKEQDFDAVRAATLRGRDTEGDGDGA